MARRGGQKRDGGSMSRLQTAQESAANHWRELGLCNLDARAAAEGRRLFCPDCIEIKEEADRGPN